MRVNYFGIDSGDTLVRMMLRANHIYILFSGLIHLLLSYTISKEKRSGFFQIVASFMLVLSTIGLNISFYLDPIDHLGFSTSIFQRILTGNSLIGFLIGTVLHLINLQVKEAKK
ncbi:MAG: hypothetical protein Tsb0034_28770 [Ekhidna sp.]